jgi:hypothetical protein
MRIVEVRGLLAVAEHGGSLLPAYGHHLGPECTELRLFQARHRDETPHPVSRVVVRLSDEADLRIAYDGPRRIKAELAGVYRHLGQSREPLGMVIPQDLVVNEWQATDERFAELWREAKANEAQLLEAFRVATGADGKT